MLFKYIQKTGELFQFAGRTGWQLVGMGYSGNTTGLNNPDAEDQHNVGPVPRGLWHVSSPYNDPHRGNPCFSLNPLTYTGPRGGFLIHADNMAANHTASEGCIILSQDIRQKLVNLKISYLLVEAEENNVH